MILACEELPINWGFKGKGNSAVPEPLIEQLEAGACGLKDHEDWGTTPAVLDQSLSVADKYDIQVSIHTDTLNEAGFVEDSAKASDGRTVHTYHTEGAGGGHAPDIMEIAGEKPGPRIGFILHALLEEVLDDPKLNTEENIQKMALKLAQMSDSELAKLGKKKEAIATAQDSMAKAKAFDGGDFGYVKRNEDLIASLK